MKIRLSDNTEFEIIQISEQIKRNGKWELFFVIQGNYDAQTIYSQLEAQANLTIILIDEQNLERTFNNYNNIVSISTNFDASDLNNSETSVVLNRVDA